MSNKIQIQNGQAEGYTAKEAMRRVVEAVQDRTAHAIEVFTIEDEKGLEAESLLFAKMFMRFLHKNQGRVLLLAENDIMLSGTGGTLYAYYPYGKDIDIKQIGKGKDLIFTATVSLKPEVKLGKYKGVAADKTVYEVEVAKPEEVDLNNL